MYPLYKEYEKQSKLEEQGESIVTEKDTKVIVNKMQKEGIEIEHFLNHLPFIVDQKGTVNETQDTRMIKLATLLK